MKRILFLTGIILCAGIPALAQQSGYGGDGKASSSASVSSFIRLYETAPSAATTALAGAGAGNVDNGVHLTKVTCYTPGGETTGGTASNTTTVVDKTANGKIAISAIPLCSSIATGRKVYMTAAGGSSYFLLSNGTIADNTTTTLTANDSDATLAASTVMPTRNTALDTRLTIGQSYATFATALSGPLGSAAAPTYGFASGSGMYSQAGGLLNFSLNGARTWQMDTSGNFSLLSTGSLFFGASQDAYIKRLAANVIASGNSDGWFQNGAGEGALTAAFTNATTTFASSNLSYTVIAGRSYRIHGILAIANSTAGHGVKLDFNGGNATATTFWATATVLSGGTVTAGTLTSSSLAGVINFTSVTGTVYVMVDGYLKVNAAGTFILRAAEDSTGGASASLGVGSWIGLSDTVLK